MYMMNLYQVEDRISYGENEKKRETKKKEKRKK